MDTSPKELVGCLNDGDCRESLVCFRNITFIPESATVGVCSCNTFYDWTGDDCTELGPGTFFILAANFLMMLISVLGIAYCCRILYYMVSKSKLSANATATTLASASMAFLFMLLWRISETINALSPEAFTTVLGNGRKRGPWGVQIQIFGSICSLFSVFAVMNVSLVWMEVAERASKMDSRVHTNVERYRKVLIGMGCSMTLIMTIFFAINQLGFALFVVMPFILIIIATFTCGGNKMKNMLSEAVKSSSGATAKKYKSMVRNIKRTSLYCSLFMFLLVVSSALYGITEIFNGGYKGWSTPGAPIKINVFFNEAVSACMLTTLCIVARYVSGSVLRKRKAGQSEFQGSTTNTNDQQSSYQGQSSQQLVAGSSSKYLGASPPSFTKSQMMNSAPALLVDSDDEDDGNAAKLTFGSVDKLI